MESILSVLIFDARLHSGELGKHIPMIAAEITGSVGVRQADIAKQDIRLSDGNSNNKKPGGCVQLDVHR